MWNKSQGLGLGCKVRKNIFYKSSLNISSRSFVITNDAEDVSKLRLRLIIDYDLYPHK